jgi:hypothetical protein
MNVNQKAHYPLIRTIYLYLFALLGLVLITIGGVRFIDMALKVFVFTKAENEERITYQEPPMLPLLPSKTEGNKNNQEKMCLTEEEKQIFNNWMTDYKNWKEKREKFDYLASKRQKEASYNLAMILVGLPLYLYHWRIIKKETKNS